MACELLHAFTRRQLRIFVIKRLHELRSFRNVMAATGWDEMIAREATVFWRVYDRDFQIGQNCTSYTLLCYSIKPRVAFRPSSRKYGPSAYVFVCTRAVQSNTPTRPSTLNNYDYHKALRAILTIYTYLWSIQYYNVWRSVAGYKTLLRRPVCSVRIPTIDVILILYPTINRQHSRNWNN